MRKALSSVLNRYGAADGHLLADYPANGSGHMTQLRECNRFGNIRFVYNALARTKTAPL